MNRFLLVAFSLILILCLAAISAADSSLPPPPNIRLTNYPQLNNEQQVFLCPTDSNVIIANWRDFRLGYRRVGIGRSDDGGLSWTDSLIHTFMMAYGLDSKQSDPTMTVDRFGNFYMSVLDWDAFGFTGESIIAFYKSIDKGISWTGPFNHLNHIPPIGIFEDKQFIAADRTGGIYDGNVYVSWTRFYNGPNRMIFSSSPDGEVFGDSVTIGPVQTSSACGASEYFAGQFSIPIVSSNGNVHVYWMGVTLDSSVCSWHYTIKHVVSSDGGQSFTYEDTVTTVEAWMSANGGINTYSQPVADADITDGPFDGNIYLCFTDRTDEDASNSSDVDFIRSTDNSVTWSERIQINDGADSENNDSFHPWLVVNEEGIIIVVFYDQRYNGPSFNDFDLVAAYSFDGGLSFTSNHRITTVSSSPFDLARSSDPIDPVWNKSDSLAPMRTPRAGLIGEYIGVTAYHDKVNAVWTDSRDGNSECYTANWYLPLLEPRLSGPGEGAVTLATPTFEWATSWKHDDDRYRLEVSTDNSFTTLETNAVVDTPYVTLGSPLTDGEYFWRVKTFKISTGDSSDYSETRMVVIDATPPEMPLLVHPEQNDIINVAMPWFDWSDVSRGGSPVTYDLLLSEDNSFPGGATTVYADLPQSEYQVPNPVGENVVTYWKVIARDAAGNETEAASSSFTYVDFVCGDIDNDSAIPSVIDLLFLVDYLYGDGPPPPIPTAADIDGGGDLSILDVIYLVEYLFKGGPPPVC